MSRTIAWLVPYPLAGSGGHRTIYQNIAVLGKNGYDCHVFVEPAPSNAERKYDSSEGAEALVTRYFGATPATFHLGLEIDRPCDAAFATAWFTAEALRASSFPRKKAYFIQDHEASFMPVCDAFMMAQNSFRYGFHGITIGRWLSSRIHRDFGMPCASFDFCADKAVYRRREDVAREKAVCFVYQPEKPRRCTVIGGQALAIVKSQMPDVKLYFYGNDQSPTLPYEIEHLGLISVEACNELYNRCAVGLCISATNPSRIPFEMMAAGLPVVDIYGDNNLYDMPDSAVSLAEPTPESIAHAILQLLGEPAEQRSRSDSGVAFMRDRDLQHGFDQFLAFVDMIVNNPGLGDVTSFKPVYQELPVIAPEEAKCRYRAAAARDAAIREAIICANPFPERSMEPAPADSSPPVATPASVPSPASVLSRAARRLEHTFRVLLTGR